jgi:hypothetical protein
MIASEAKSAHEVVCGDTFFIYDPNRHLVPNLKFPFATIEPRPDRSSRSPRIWRNATSAASRTLIIP